ncbi:hypothetical protein DERF_000371 [Dermatophagoides farinae]|uniref:Uncharacterized protein n=1 Tax=Dermatophagoides farinae TaxID=6954 RepID=A0A922LCE8_DERFA|nr:hypothetical protein DERF_000371 [Dermatophagoides farinae]
MANQFSIFSGLLLKCLQMVIMVKAFQKQETMDNQMPLDQMMMIPYKTVYGISEKCIKTSDDHQLIKKNYQSCQIDAWKKWHITLHQFYTESVNFCCFVYEALECEMRILSKCDIDYSDHNEKETRRLFDKSCQSIMKNNACNLSDDSDYHIYIYYGLIVIGSIGTIMSVAYGGKKIYRWLTTSRETRLEMKAAKLYKKDKFNERYEREYIRAVYEEQVDDIDDELFQNTFNIHDKKSANFKNKSTRSFAKSEKKLKKKIWSDINKELKKDNSDFWDDFNKKSEKYYKELLDVEKKKSWKFWSWSKKETKNVEKNKKRDEFIKSKARLQYEEIKKDNQLRLDKKLEATQNKIKDSKLDLTDDGIQMIERELGKKIRPQKIVADKDVDPLLAKTINILNQEQVDVHHEMLRTKNFKEIKQMNQLETWSTKLKDTRTRIRDSRKMEVMLETLEPTDVNKIPAIDDTNLKSDKQKPQEVDSNLKSTKQKPQELDSNLKSTKQKPQEVDLNLKSTKQKPQEVDSNLKSTKQKPQNKNQTASKTGKEMTKNSDSGISNKATTEKPAIITKTDSKNAQEPKKEKNATSPSETKNNMTPVKDGSKKEESVSKLQDELERHKMLHNEEIKKELKKFDNAIKERNRHIDKIFSIFKQSEDNMFSTVDIIEDKSRDFWLLEIEEKFKFYRLALKMAPNADSYYNESNPENMTAKDVMRKFSQLMIETQIKQENRLCGPIMELVIEEIFENTDYVKLFYPSSNVLKKQAKDTKSKFHSINDPIYAIKPEDRKQLIRKLMRDVEIKEKFFAMTEHRDEYPGMNVEKCSKSDAISKFLTIFNREIKNDKMNSTEFDKDIIKQLSKDKYLLRFALPKNFKDVSKITANVVQTKTMNIDGNRAKPQQHPSSSSSSSSQSNMQSTTNQAGKSLKQTIKEIATQLPPDPLTDILHQS